MLRRHTEGLSDDVWKGADVYGDNMKNAARRCRLRGMSCEKIVQYLKNRFKQENKTPGVATVERWVRADKGLEKQRHNLMEKTKQNDALSLQNALLAEEDRDIQLLHALENHVKVHVSSAKLSPRDILALVTSVDRLHKRKRVNRYGMDVVTTVTLEDRASDDNIMGDFPS